MIINTFSAKNLIDGGPTWKKINKAGLIHVIPQSAVF